MKSSIVLAALAGVANALVAFTNNGYEVTPGSEFDLQWSGATGPVTITLKNGPKGNLQTVTILASGVTADSVSVVVPATLPPGLYAFEIDDGTTTNYSPQFNFQGTGTSALPSKTASVTGSSTASATSDATITSTGSSSASSTESSTSSRTPRSTTPAPSQTGVVNTNAAQRQGSSLALLLVSAVALFYMC